MMKLHNFAIIGIVAALLIVPFQFEIYAPKGYHLSQYYGYAFLFNPPTRSYISPYTTSILWERVFIEIAIILILNYFWSRKAKQDEEIRKAVDEVVELVEQTKDKKIYTVSTTEKKDEPPFIVTRQFGDAPESREAPSPIILKIQKYIKFFFKTILIIWVLWVAVFFTYVLLMGIKEILFS